MRAGPRANPYAGQRVEKISPQILCETDQVRGGPMRGPRCHP